jgi:hypothetical protein
LILKELEERFPSSASRCILSWRPSEDLAKHSKRI